MFQLHVVQWFPCIVIHQKALEFSWHHQKSHYILTLSLKIYRKSIPMINALFDFAFLNKKK